MTCTSETISGENKTTRTHPRAAFWPARPPARATKAPGSKQRFDLAGPCAGKLWMAFNEL
jgi:hypothetical protein